MPTFSFKNMCLISLALLVLIDLSIAFTMANSNFADASTLCIAMSLRVLVPWHVVTGKAFATLAAEDS